MGIVWDEQKRINDALGTMEGQARGAAGKRLHAEDLYAGAPAVAVLP